MSHSVCGAVAAALTVFSAGNLSRITGVIALFVY